jgi:hypothetical protein
MKSTMPFAGDGKNKAKPDAKDVIRSEKKLQTPTQNRNQLKIIKSATVGHVRGGHAFH